MTVLQQCVDETLRLHPPFFQVARRVQNDVQFKDTLIPKGRLVCISPGAVMRLESMFERPNEFDPSRFDKESDFPAHSFIPFGGGRHICTGRKFALTAIKTVTSWLLRNYTFESVKTIPLPDYSSMVVAPGHSKGQCNVTFKKK